MRGLILLLLLLPLTGGADVYKYVDSAGKIYFTDSPLQGDDLKLEWKRDANKIATEKNAKVVAMGQSRTRTLIEPSPAKLSARRARYERTIELIAGQEKVNSELLHAVVRAESAYNPGAVSPAGATGLMQLMPATAARYKVQNIEDPTENLRGGARYLRDLLNLFGNDLQLALAAYNAGENAVAQYGNRIPPYPETQRYVRKVLQFLWAERTSANKG
ncbi:MAG: lytic transglycosylase domain-containing protein [Chromatiaceae bacterium]